MTNHLHEYRCDCGKLLFKSPFFTGRIEVKCRRCGFIKAFEEATKQSAQALQYAAVPNGRQRTST